MEYLWACGTLIHDKNLSSKISCQTPFKKKAEVSVFNQPCCAFREEPVGWGGGGMSLQFVTTDLDCLIVCKFLS
jgi:hypothetical protein